MSKYKLTDSGVIDTETGACIPNAPGNRHWRKYQEWLAEDNTPDPADPEPAPPTNEEIYDQTMQNQKLLKAMVIALNKAGAFSPTGTVLSNPVLKTLIKGEM